MSQAKMQENEISLEDAFDQIEEAISKLSDENISLEDSFEIYKDGMKLLKICSERIECVEKKVLAINAKGELDEF